MVITAVILAAGAATRFGGPKQIAEIDGEPLVHRSIRTARVAGARRIVCVVGAHIERVRPALSDLEVHVVDNPKWRLGLSTSIVCGVRAAIHLGETESLAVLLADQPFIPASHLRALHTQREDNGAPVAATAYEHGVGVPAVFGASLFPALQTLTGDRGAAKLIRNCARSVSVAVPSAAVLDIDSPADLRAARRAAGEVE